MKPKAWRSSAGIAYVCAWCPDKDAADALALSLGLAISHGICRECRAALGFPSNDETFNASAAGSVPGLLESRPGDTGKPALPDLSPVNA